MFLMYRVELKANTLSVFPVISSLVPNVPCGVERSKMGRELKAKYREFLMYRVELKEAFAINVFIFLLLFLMYRVELKDNCKDLPATDKPVPNVPCGVERCLTFLLMALSLVPNVPCGVERTQAY